jgi:cytochrome c peroxidase
VKTKKRLPAALPAAALSALLLLPAAAAEEAAPSFGAPAAAVAFEAREERAILRMSPLPPPPEDASNRVAGDARAAAFGRRLYFDRRLSKSGAMSCATCHDPERAWANGEKTMEVESLFPKNVPSLRNNVYNRWYYWDGRADSSWSQALGPLENDREMASDRLGLLHLLRGDRELAAAYREIFGELPAAADDPGRFPPAAKPLPKEPENPLQKAWAAMSEDDRHAANRVFSNLGKAIAAFERGILVGETRLDRYVARLKKEGRAAAAAELPPAALRGLKLFAGRGACTLCHSGATLSDGEFHDVGIALGIGRRVDPGRFLGIATLRQSQFARNGAYADAKEPEAPIEFLQRPQTAHLGSFKTPTLRGVAETAPYMHDGRFATLEEVVRFYSTRQNARPLGHPTTLLQPLNLTDAEIADLVAFLESLSPLAGGENGIR